MFVLFLQRPKKMVLEGLVRMVVGSKVGWSRKAKGVRGRVGRTKRGLERGESFGDLVRE